MSLDKPNPHEALIEDYAEAALRETVAEEALKKAVKEKNAASIDMQEKWRAVSALVGTGSGDIQPGIYRLARKHGCYAEGVLILSHHDYPTVYPMWRK